MLWVRQAQGVGIFRQAVQMFALARREKMTPREYYENALFRPAMSAEQRRQYLSFDSARRLNLRLSPVGLRGLHGLFTDKLLCAFVLAQAGIATLPTLALFATAIEVPALRVLKTPQALADWLLREAPLPVFGKPLHGSLGLGGASIMDREGTALVLGDGRRIEAAVLAAEVARLYPDGWQVQPLLRLHPELAELCGPAAGMLRICTLRHDAGTEALYAYQRLPAPGSMIDTNSGTAANAYAAIDLETGAMVRVQDNWRMNLGTCDRAPATGVPLAGRRVPFIAEARRLCEAAHRLVPQAGVLGFDVALTADGPLIVEVNGNPHHHSWQRAADRGLMNPDFAPRIARAVAETARREASLAAETARIRGKRQA